MRCRRLNADEPRFAWSGGWPARVREPLVPRSEHATLRPPRRMNDPTADIAGHAYPAPGGDHPVRRVAHGLRTGDAVAIEEAAKGDGQAAPAGRGAGADVWPRGCFRLTCMD
jgi:hypothetical protein